MGVTRIWWDVDTQHDFMHPDGKLYVPGAEEIVDNLRTLRELARRHGIRTVASADDHRMDHPEISTTPDYETTFPPHCLHGTPGQAKIAETALVEPMVIEPSPRDPDELRRALREHDGDVLLHKHEFDVFTNPNVDTVLSVIDPDEIVLFGVALDVCNRFAVEGLLVRRPGTKLLVVTDAVRAIDQARGARLLEAWAQRGVELVTTATVVERYGAVLEGRA